VPHSILSYPAVVIVNENSKYLYFPSDSWFVFIYLLIYPLFLEITTLPLYFMKKKKIDEESLLMIFEHCCGLDWDFCSSASDL
jgi:hypothetical protein